MFLLSKIKKQQFLFYLFINFHKKRNVKFLNLLFIFQLLSQPVNPINQTFHFPGFVKPIGSGIFCFLNFLFHCLKQQNLINLLQFFFFFSGGEPYPNISLKHLVSQLKSGYRMGKPINCADSMFALLALPLFHFLVFCYLLGSLFSCQYHAVILRYLK